MFCSIIIDKFNKPPTIKIMTVGLVNKPVFGSGVKEEIAARLHQTTISSPMLSACLCACLLACVRAPSVNLGARGSPSNIKDAACRRRGARIIKPEQ